MFAHIPQVHQRRRQRHPLSEMARVLTDDGLLICTFFVFDKVGFPFMQGEPERPLHQRNRRHQRRGLRPRHGWRAVWRRATWSWRGADPPAIRGYHWRLRIGAPVRAGFPSRGRPTRPGTVGSPRRLLRSGASRLGLDEAVAEAAEVHVRRRCPPPVLLPELDAARAAPPISSDRRLRPGCVSCAAGAPLTRGDPQPTRRLRRRARRLRGPRDGSGPNARTQCPEVRPLAVRGLRHRRRLRPRWSSRRHRASVPARDSPT